MPRHRKLSEVSVPQKVTLGIAIASVAAVAIVSWVAPGGSAAPGSTTAAVTAAALAERSSGEVSRSLDRQVIPTPRAFTPRGSATQEATPSPQPKTTTTNTYVVPSKEACQVYSGNKQIACNLLDAYGFGLEQMDPLIKLWNRESGWNELAQNPSSGAYGIPQALPGSKMGTVADDWRTNPATQIRWGLGYIKGRYGTPAAAWAHSESVGWY